MLTKFVLSYFKFFAKLQLRKNPRATIIGITGSYGKTSTRLALVQILKGRGVVKHSAHANSESGIPLNILGIHPNNFSKLDWLRMMILAPIQLLTFSEKYDYYVVEMGIDSPYPPKNMDYLLTIIRPHLAIVLSAGMTHAANFDSLVKDTSPTRRASKLIELVAREKMKLARSIPPAGTSIVNQDDAHLAKHLPRLSSRLLTFGKSTKASFRITNTSVSRSGFSLRFLYQGQAHELKLRDIFGVEYGYTFAAALSSACALGIPLTHSIVALKNYRAPAGRLRLFKGIKNSHLIDSTYNASPQTLKDSLLLLKELGKRAHRIAVIGDMNELGKSSKVAHQNLSSEIMRNADEAILFGTQTAAFTLPRLASQRFPAKHFSQMSELVAYLKNRVKEGSWILFKGSQNQILLERAVEAVLADPNDTKLLARRGKYWDHVRHSTP